MSSISLKRVGKATLIYGSGKVMPQIIRFVLLPVFAAFLGPEDYGVLEIVGTAAATLAVVGRFGMPGAVTRAYFEHREGDTIRSYLTTVATALAATHILLFLATLLTAGWWRPAVMPQVPLVPLVVLALGTFLVAPIGEIQDRLIQAREQAGLMAKLHITRALVSVTVALALVVGFGWKAEGIIAGELVAQVVYSAYAIWYLRSDLRGRLHMTHLRDAANYGFGLFGGHFLQAVMPFAMATLLARLESVAVLGTLTIANRFARPLQLALSAFARAYAPVYFDERTKLQESPDGGASRFAEVADSFWSMGVLAALVLAMAGPAAVRLLLPEVYHPAALLIPIVVAGALAQLAWAVVAQEIFFQKRTWVATLANLPATLLPVPLALVLVPRYGAAGMATATALAYIAAMFGGFFAVAAIGRRYLVLWPFFRSTVLGVSLFAGFSFLVGLHGALWESALAVLVASLVYALALACTKSQVGRKMRSVFGGDE